MTKQNDLALIKKDTVDVVANKVKEFQESGDVKFPPSYSPENAMKSAWLILQNTQDRNKQPALQACTKDSIANSLLNMVVQGLNPAKNQGYFIVYGNQLTFQRSYFGTMAVTKQVTGAKSIDAAVIYKGDDVDYEMENSRIVNLKHKQQFGNIDKENIIGAYATIVLPDGEKYQELMTMDEIRKAWSKSQMWGKGNKKEREGSTHDEFKQEMAKKTVINRACKKFLNSSNDSNLMLHHFHQTDEEAEQAQADQEVKENANGEVIDIEYNDPDLKEEKPAAEPEPQPKEEKEEEAQDVTDDDLQQTIADFEKKEEAVENGPGF